MHRWLVSSFPESSRAILSGALLAVALVSGCQKSAGSDDFCTCRFQLCRMTPGWVTLQEFQLRYPSAVEIPCDVPECRQFRIPSEPASCRFVRGHLQLISVAGGPTSQHQEAIEKQYGPPSSTADGQATWRGVFGTLVIRSGKSAYVEVDDRTMTAIFDALVREQSEQRSFASGQARR
jgi:hypothetical protein